MTKIIDASKKSFFPDLKELWRYKDLLYTLTWRDFRIRYAQTTVGLLWAVIQPLFTLAILHLVFGTFIGVDVKIPHLVFTVAGMSIWTYISYVITNSGSSIISNQAMVKKIYFPRIIIPLSKAFVGLIDLGITLIILIGLLIYYKIDISSTIWFAPLFILMAIIAALGIGIWLSALTVRYRDFQHVVPFLVQIGLYLSPVAYPAEFATQKLPLWAANLYYLNPVAGIIQGFRWSLFGGEFPGNMMWLSFGMVIFTFLSGIWYFNKSESEMADYV
jgi:lipopolysaccharide transport system permease protein